MALFGNSGGLISAGLNLIGGAYGGNLGSAIQLGAQTIGQLSQPTSRPVAVGPTPASMPVAQPTMSGAPAIGAMGSAITVRVQQILIQIASFLGLRTLSLRRVLKWARRAGRFLGPAGVAAALGISVSELGTLILADQQRTRRRMNPANASALRRAHRRVESFHRLCQKNDCLRTTRRSYKRSCKK